MKFGKSFLVVFFLGMVMFCGSLSVKADESLVMRPMEKLGRGITNVAFCALELPMKWNDVSSEQGALAGLTYGTLRGVCYVVARAQTHPAL